MLSTPKLLIHIGYPKTASSWLQKGIFQDKTAGFLAPWRSPSGEAIAQFVIPNAFRFSAESVRKVLEPGLQEAARQNLVPVLSHEHLACNQIRGRYHGKEAADRLYATFPEARILVFIREQKSMILSSYRQYIRGGNGETATIQQFIGAETKPAFEPTCRLDYLEYDLLIAYYQNLFGSENLLVLPFELIKIQPEDVLKEIIDFAEAKEINPTSITYPSKNVGFKAGTLAVKRRLNHIIKEPNFGATTRRTLNWRIVDKISKTIDSIPFLDGFHQGIENDWKQFIAEYVGDYFRLSNQRTSQLIGMNLADFGYDC